MDISVFWQISVEDQVEMVAIDRNLVNNFFLLVVKEIFKNLLFCLFVVTLPHKSQPTHLNLSLIKEWFVDDFVEHIGVLGVPDFLVYLPEFASLKQLVQHSIGSLLH